MTVMALLALAAVLSLALPCMAGGDGVKSVVPLWGFDNEGDATAVGNDNTGAVFETVAGLAPNGSGALRVIPDGKAVETKVALELSGDRLKAWTSANGDVLLGVYVPPGAATVPGMFFIGLADVTEGWAWVGGEFAKPETVPGWNEVRYPVPQVMSLLEPTRRYMVYLAFSHTDGGVKSPLRDAFLIDAVSKEHDPGKSAVTRIVPPEIAKEAEGLAKVSDTRLLDLLSKRTFEYFRYETDPVTGLTKDRSTRDSFASIAATGFALTAIPIGVERGWITRGQGLKRALATLRGFLPRDQGGTGLAQGHKGFFYHFLDMKTGRRLADVELSSIDTAILVSGALTVGRYFADTEAAPLARRIYENVEWDWMLAGGSTLSMGWGPESGFIAARWDHFSELASMYLLAIGSPTHPIPAASWHAVKRPLKAGKDGSNLHVSLPQEPLFVYQYPHCWVDFRGVEDAYADYWMNSVAATLYNRDFCAAKAGSYPYLGQGIWGLSASDGPGGYRAYGASEGNVDGTVAPYASVASMPFTPAESMAALRAMLTGYKGLVWGKYGLTSAFNPRYGWFSGEHIGIDQGDILVMIENHRTGLVWRLFMGVPEVRAAMAAVGFRQGGGAYAVVPDYARSVQGFK